MKPIKRFSPRLLPVLAVFLAFLAFAPRLAANSNQDSLPLGPSTHRFILDKVEKDGIIDTATGKTVTIEDIVAAHPDADVFVIGETHDNVQCHTFQRDFIKALHEKHPRLVVGFEFFQRQEDPLLEKWIKGKISEEQLLEKVGWYSRSAQNYGFTRVIMDMLRERRIKTIGLNVPREILRKISREGFDALPEKEKKLFPTLSVPNPEHQYFIKGMFGAFPLQMPQWFENFYTAQTCWDVVMAESMRVALSKRKNRDHKGVIIAGGNHVAYQLGIPFRYRAAQENVNRKKVNIVTIMPVQIYQEAEKPKETQSEETKSEETKSETNERRPHPGMGGHGGGAPMAVFSRGLADYVFAAWKPLRAHFPSLGVSVEEKDGALEVKQVVPGGPAARGGIRKGDRITSVDGTPATSVRQLRATIAGKNWDDSISIDISKKIQFRAE